MKQHYPKKFLLFLLLCIMSAKTIDQTYAWKNVKVGAGGFVSGLVFNLTQSNLFYARTDAVGAYRWNAAPNTWVPLTDFMAQDEENYSGILSLTTDHLNCHFEEAATCFSFRQVLKILLT